MGGRPAKLAINVPYLRGLSMTGTAEGTFSGFDTRASIDFSLDGASKLELKEVAVGDTAFDVSGASEVSGSITAGDVRFRIGGASTAGLRGSASNIACNVSGASQLNLDDFTVDNADVRLSGASAATINLTGKLDVNLSGASDLGYYGEPVMGDTKISSASTMSRK